MNDAVRMQVSAFVDGELPENETELLLRRLSQDPALRQLVAGYLSIGRAIRREREIPGMNELRGRIASSLGEEPPIGSQPASEPRRLNWLKPVAGLAIAASVAALAVVGLRGMQAPPGPAGETMQAAAPAPVAYTQPAPAEGVTGQPSDTLMQYYLRHGETSADLGPNGILTRLVTLELRHGDLEQIEPTRTTLPSTRPVDGAGQGNEPDNAADDDDTDNDD